MGDRPPAQPRISGLSAKTRFRHYLNLHKTGHRLNKLLRDFAWGRVTDVFDIECNRSVGQRDAVSETAVITIR